MTADELQTFLHTSIPLVGAMQIAVDTVAADSVTLRAPLAPNRNHHGTGFGGSIAAVAVLAGWSLLHVRLHSAGIDAALVVRRSELDYEQAIDGDFTARATLADESEWATFERMLQRKGRARIATIASLDCGGQVAARFKGEFVAVRGSSTRTIA